MTLGATPCQAKQAETQQKKARRFRDGDRESRSRRGPALAEVDCDRTVLDSIAVLYFRRATRAQSAALLLAARIEQQPGRSRSSMLYRVNLTLLALLSLLSVSCSPAVGSEAWCKELQEKPKADWSANDVGGYAKHCVLK